MASRKTWAQITQQTVEILERGWYTLPDEMTVSLGYGVRNAVQRTRHFVPGEPSAMCWLPIAILSADGTIGPLGLHGPASPQSL